MRGAGYIQLRASLDGSFEHEIAAARGNIVTAMGLGMEELADELVSKLRQDFISSELNRAERLSRGAWRRSEIYGKGLSMEPAALVFSKLPVIVQAFENGQTIRARGGKGLLIPNPDVWPAGRVVLPKRSSNMRGLWDIATARFGELRVVKRPGKTTLVVAEARASAARAGTFRKASASALRRAGEGKASGLATIIVFVIAREAKQPKLLRGEVIRARALANAPRRMDQLFLKYFATVGTGQRQLTGPAPSPRTIGGFWD